jgi:DivIVA domain-containing protein
MELTPQTLHAVEFREARRGGYNTRDVDDFIERVAAGVGHLNERVREAQARAEAADARVVEAQREVDELRRRPAAAAPVPEVSETDETLRRTLVLAQRTADATVKEAKEEANRVLSEAREEAARTRAEAEAEARRGAEAARVAAQTEVESLLADRGKLKADIDALTRRMEEQRNQLRAGVDEMQRLLDDPAGLKPLGVPSLADVEPRTPAAAPAFAGGPAADGGNGGNGHEGAGNGAARDLADDATARHDEPAPPASSAAPPAVDLGPPTQPSPFGLSTDARGPWLPSELTPPADEPLGPGPVPTPPAGNGVPPAASDPGSRPSDWGRATFDDKASDGTQRFGRR